MPSFRRLFHAYLLVLLTAGLTAAGCAPVVHFVPPTLAVGKPADNSLVRLEWKRDIDRQHEYIYIESVDGVRLNPRGDHHIVYIEPGEHTLRLAEQIRHEWVKDYWSPGEIVDGQRVIVGGYGPGVRRVTDVELTFEVTEYLGPAGAAFTIDKASWGCQNLYRRGKTMTVLHSAANVIGSGVSAPGWEKHCGRVGVPTSASLQGTRGPKAFPVTPGKASLYIFRDDPRIESEIKREVQYGVSMPPPRVVVDGRTVGYLYSESYLLVPVEPGAHKIVMKAGSYYGDGWEALVEVIGEPGKNVFVRQEVQEEAGKTRTRLLLLDEKEGRERLSKCISCRLLRGGI